MGDLISRSAVIELLQKNMTRDIQDQIITENNINLIRSVPTAYDVEKVVAEMKKASKTMMPVIPTNDAVAIVRKGGVE